jgi:katanin p60 ATPase-containing subunit A1
MSATLMALRANSEANTAEQKRLADKRRNILVLIHQHLIENGYVEAAERLQHEAGNVICKFEVADNVDFGLILGDYESYYEMRFDRKPKLVRKLKDGEECSRLNAGRQSRQSESAGSNRKQPKEKSSGNGKLPNVNGASSSTAQTAPEDDSATSHAGGFGVSGVSIGSSIDSANSKQKKSDSDLTDKESFEER